MYGSFGFVVPGQKPRKFSQGKAVSPSKVTANTRNYAADSKAFADSVRQFHRGANPYTNEKAPRNSPASVANLLRYRTLLRPDQVLPDDHKVIVSDAAVEGLKFNVPEAERADLEVVCVTVFGAALQDTKVCTTEIALNACM